MRYNRCHDLFGDDFDKIQNTKILLLGVGGVGGFALDALVRSGIDDITIVDFDTFEESNQNRQLLSEALGEKKVDVFQREYPKLTAIDAKVSESWCKEFDFSEYDLVLDAIDDISAKVALAHRVSNKLICSLGGAKRIDPTKIEFSTIWKTHGDPLAKKFRYELKQSGFKDDFDVVFSTEKPKTSSMGSFVGVTASMGLALASLAIKRIVG